MRAGEFSASVAVGTTCRPSAPTGRTSPGAAITLPALSTMAARPVRPICREARKPDSASSVMSTPNTRSTLPAWVKRIAAVMPGTWVVKKMYGDDQ